MDLANYNIIFVSNYDKAYIYVLKIRNTRYRYRNLRTELYHPNL